MERARGTRRARDRRPGTSLRQSTLHERVYSTLLEDISHARIGVGEKLPTESDLCRQFKVSRITVRHALNRLSNDGLISRTPRRGTIVRSNVPDLRRGWTVDTINDIVRFGQHASLTVLSYEPRRLSAQDADILQASRGFELQGLRCARRRPIGFTSILLPARIGACLSLDDFRSNTVFTLLVELLGLPVGEIQERVAACPSSGSPGAKHLKCAPGSALLYVERTYFDSDHRPLELARSWYLSSDFSIQHRIGVLKR
jgi:GntR family transcriptional regulator